MADRPRPVTERVRECRTPDDFRALFTNLGLWPESWRMTARPVGTPGARCRRTVYDAVRADMRFADYALFMRWMDGQNH